jgi:AAA family ATP:ADP antiporter
VTEDRLSRTLSRIADVRPGESRTALLLFLYFFLITFPAYIVKPVKVSLFFVSFSDRFLPLPYLLTALLIGFVVGLNLKLLRTLPRRRFISLSIAFFIAGFVLFWLLWVVLKANWNGLSLIYWFWSDVFIATSVTQFWITVNDVLHPHQAKRLVGFFVSGGLLGGFGGALLAWNLARAIGTENLLLFCPAVLVLTLIVVNLVYVDRSGEDDRGAAADSGRGLAGSFEGFHIVRKNRYLLLMAGLLGAGAVVGTLIELQFNTILRWRFPSRDPRTAFLGSFFAALLLVSYLVQLFGTGRILRRFGVRAGLLVAPVVLLAGAASVFLFPTASLIVWAVLIKGADKGLENSLSQSARELLYLPVPADIKYKAKMFVDMFINKFSTALGALLFFLFYTVFHVGLASISFITIVFLVLSLLLVRVIFGEYVGVVKKDLERRWEDGEKVVAERMDVDSARLVFDTIQSRERSSVLYTMNLFDLVRKDKLTPELKEVLVGKDGELRARSMDSLLDVGGGSFFAGMEDVLADEEFGTQIKEVFELEAYRKVMGEHLEKAAGEGRESEVERMEAAKVLGMMMPEPRVIRQLGRFLRDPSPDVLNYALDSAARLKRKELIPLIIQQLGNPLTRQVARDALAAYGGRILGALVRNLKDPKQNISVRRALPEVLARMGTQRAADALAAELVNGHDEIEPEIIEALYRIRSGTPGIVFREKRIVPAILAQVRMGFKVLLESRPGEAPGSRLAFRIKRIFDLLSLIYPSEDIVKAYQNICQGTRKSIDYSLELLDNVVRKDIKEFLFPLIEDLPPEEKIRRCRKLFRALEKKGRDPDLKGGPAFR